MPSNTITLQVLPSDESLKLQKITEKIRKLFPQGCQRILLVCPSTVIEQDFNIKTAKRCSYSATLPYGPALLAAQLKRFGYEVLLADINYELLYQAHHNPDFSYQIWKEILKQNIDSFQPDLVGISGMFSTMHQCVIETAQETKQINSNLPIIAGGVHPTQYPKLYLEKCPEIDLLMTHEADISFPNLINLVNYKVGPETLSQLATIVDGQFCEIATKDTPGGEQFDVRPDFGNLPIGEYTSVGMIGAYRWLTGQKRKAGTIQYNRGCRAHCTFCSVENFNGKGVRTRKIQNVVDEMKWMFEIHGINQFLWLDDDLLFGRPIELFNAITKSGLPITWEASNGVIASATTKEIVHAAADSGCIGLHFGIESGNADILKSVQKPSGIKHFYRVGEIMRDHPQIFTRGMLMLGFKGVGPNGQDETIEQIKDTIKLAQEIEMDWYPIQIVNFLGNTKMSKELLQRGLLNEQAMVDASFFIGVVGGQTKREEKEKTKASQFTADILERPSDYSPDEEELKDVWFLMDWLLNYKPILKQTNRIKLELKRLFLTDICQRKTVGNPLSTMFLGIVEAKLGNINDAVKNFEQAKRFLSESAFWQVRWDALNLQEIIETPLEQFT